MGRKFVNRLRTFPLFLTNIYELIYEHLRTLRFVYELWGSFTNLRVSFTNFGFHLRTCVFRLRTLGFTSKVRKPFTNLFFCVYELSLLGPFTNLHASFTNFSLLRTSGSLTSLDKFGGSLTESWGRLQKLTSWLTYMNFGLIGGLWGP